MKILIFHPALAPYRVDLFNLLAELYDAELVLLGKNLEEQKFDQESLLKKLKCRVSYLTRGFMLFGRYIRTGFISKIKVVQPDVVWGYEYSPLTACILFYKLLTRARFKFYTTTDDNAEMFCSTKGLRKILRSFVLKFADGVVVTNGETAELMRKRGVNAAVVPIIYKASEFRAKAKDIFEKAARLRKGLIRDNESLLLYVGRLAQVKNLSWLLDEFAAIGESDMRLVLVGAGPEEVDLRKRISANAFLSTQVNLVGRFEGDELMAYFAAADVFVLPSAFEPYGAVVSESLLWGAPCVVSTHVGARGLIDHTNGAVFDSDSIGDFKDKLHAVLGECAEWMRDRPSLLRADFGAIREELMNLMEAHT